MQSSLITELSGPEMPEMLEQGYGVDCSGLQALRMGSPPDREIDFPVVGDSTNHGLIPLGYRWRCPVGSSGGILIGPLSGPLKKNVATYMSRFFLIRT